MDERIDGYERRVAGRLRRWTWRLTAASVVGTATGYVMLPVLSVVRGLPSPSAVESAVFVSTAAGWALTWLAAGGAVVSAAGWFWAVWLSPDRDVDGLW